MRRAVVAVLCIMVGLFAGLGAVWRSYRHDLYGATFLTVVARRVTRGATTPTDVAWRLREFVYLTVRTLNDAPPLDSRPDHVLLRGYAWCDRAVFAFVHLLRERGIPGHLRFLRRADGSRPTPSPRSGSTASGVSSTPSTGWFLGAGTAPWPRSRTSSPSRR